MDNLFIFIAIGYAFKITLVVIRWNILVALSKRYPTLALDELVENTMKLTELEKNKDD